MGYALHLMTEWKDAFYENPFVFGANRLKNVSCECTKVFSSGRVGNFHFDDNNWQAPTTRTKYSPKTFDEINVTAWENLLAVE